MNSHVYDSKYYLGSRWDFYDLPLCESGLHLRGWDMKEALFVY
jgi:hypothetical protein